MKKFTKLNETNKKVDTSTNKYDFLKNLIEETLKIENGEIKGKDILLESINKIIDINNSKNAVSVLERVKAKSYRNLNLQWINESIELEKEKIKNIDGKVLKESELPKDIKLINENLDDELENEIENKLEDEIQDEIQDEILNDKEEEKDECKICSELKPGQLIYINLEGNIKVEILDIGDEDITVKRLDVKDDKENIMTFSKKDFEEIVNLEKTDDFIDSEECENCDDEEIILKEGINYMSDIDELSKILEKINSDDKLNEEHHLKSKEDRIDYILSRMDDDDVKDIIITKISQLPDYIKTSDIEKTLNNMSDEEIEELYLEVEKIK